LNKLGDAPRAYQDKLQAFEGMEIEAQPANGGGKLSLDERFGKIQGIFNAPQQGRGKTLRLIARPKV